MLLNKFMSKLRSKYLVSGTGFESLKSKKPPTKARRSPTDVEWSPAVLREHPRSYLSKLKYFCQLFRPHNILYVKSGFFHSLTTFFKNLKIKVPWQLKNQKTK